MEFHRTKIIAVVPYDNYQLWIRFDDGLSGIVDLNHLVGKGVFSAWDSIAFFRSVHIDEKSSTVVWGEDLDLDPYVLRDQVISQKKTV